MTGSIERDGGGERGRVRGESVQWRKRNTRTNDKKNAMTNTLINCCIWRNVRDLRCCKWPEGSVCVRVCARVERAAEKVRGDPLCCFVDVITLYP